MRHCPTAKGHPVFPLDFSVKIPYLKPWIDHHIKSQSNDKSQAADMYSPSRIHLGRSLSLQSPRRLVCLTSRGQSCLADRYRCPLHLCSHEELRGRCPIEVKFHAASGESMGKFIAEKFGSGNGRGKSFEALPRCDNPLLGNHLTMPHHRVDPLILSSSDVIAAALTSPSFFGSMHAVVKFIGLVMPFGPQGYIATALSIQQIIQDVSPDLIVCDGLFSEGLDAVKNCGHQFLLLSPNTVRENASGSQGLGVLAWPA